MINLYSIKDAPKQPEKVQRPILKLRVFRPAVIPQKHERKAA